MRNLYLMVLALGWTGILGLLLIAVIAAFHGGTATVDFNSRHEMWPEIGALSFIALVYPAAWIWAVRNSYEEITDNVHYSTS